MASNGLAGAEKGAAQGASTGSAGGSWGAAIGGIIGGTAGYFSGRSAAKAAKHANELVMWQQLQNQKWQEYMSNTAHQREMEDLKKSGLNPVLAANDGASTPGGGIGNTPAYESTDWTNAAKGATEGFEKFLNLKTLENQTKSTNADKGLKEKQTELTTTQNQLTDIQKQNAKIENQILNDTKYDIIDTTKATKAAEKAEAEAREGNASIEKENQSSALWRGLKGFSDAAGLMLGPIGTMMNMATSANKAATLGTMARKQIKERLYDRNGKHYIKEYEYE